MVSIIGRKWHRGDQINEENFSIGVISKFSVNAADGHLKNEKPYWGSGGGFKYTSGRMAFTQNKDHSCTVIFRRYIVCLLRNDCVRQNSKDIPSSFLSPGYLITDGSRYH